MDFYGNTFGSFRIKCYFCKKLQIMQQSTSLEAKKLDLMQMIMSIETSAALDKVAKYITRILPNSVPQELSEDTLAMMEQSRREYGEGKVLSFDSATDAQKWLEAL